jgi:predicted nucleotidyltransferase
MRRLVKEVNQTRKTACFFDIEGIKGSLAAVPEIAAGYLFGSTARQEAVVNDLDLLIIVRPGSDAERAIWELIRQISEFLGVDADRVDILLFDLRQADPKLLYRAVTEEAEEAADIAEALKQPDEEILGSPRLIGVFSIILFGVPKGF